MKKGRTRLGKAEDTQEAEQLDALNASMRSKRNAPELIRRAMEANIEAKARKKRSQEVPASAGFKKTG